MWSGQSSGGQRGGGARGKGTAEHSRNPNAPWERRGSETSGRTDQAKLGLGKKPAAPEDSPVGGLQKWGTEDAGEARIRRDGHAQRPLYAIWALSEDLGHGRNAMRTRTGLESRAAGREAPRESGDQAARREAPRESGGEAAGWEAPRESGGEAMVAQTGVAAAGRTAGELTGLRITQEGNERRPGRRPGKGRARPGPRAALTSTVTAVSISSGPGCCGLRLVTLLVPMPKPQRPAR